MRRFSDFLRILTSIVLGGILRDASKLHHTLDVYLRAAGSSRVHILSWAVSLAIVGLFIRNAHGSACYDEWRESRKSYVPTYERFVLGRVAAFAFAVLALAAGPFLTAYLFCREVPPAASIAPAVFIAALFMPIFVYGVWDIMLWLCEPESTGATPRVQEIARVWMKVDGVALFVATFSVGRYFVLARGGREMTLVEIACYFLVIVAVVIVGDYIGNHRFYFPGY
jgi:hypothetical protein